MRDSHRWRPKDNQDKRQERWLLTYSDLITLLLILFVLFYSMSSIDERIYEKVASALNSQFQKSGGTVGKEDAIDKPDKKPPADEETPLDLERLREQERVLKESLQALQAFITKNNLQNNITLKDTPRGIAITLKDLFLFDTGKADLKANAYPLLDELSKVFREVENKISIEGHTDSRPLFTGSIYTDNWGLSAARSLSVLRYFVYEKQLSAKSLLSTGYADTMPVAANDSDANRAKNRRVEIVILR
jgi:chemotaxis protein MotB